MSRFSSSKPSRAIVLLSILLCAVFLAAGGAKLAGVEMMVEVFAKIGLGQEFRYVTGAIEVVCAIGLLLSATRFYAAGLLFCTMIGATVTHLFVIGGNAIPAVVLLALTAIVAYGTRPVAHEAART